MGTRSITAVMDHGGREMATIYRQMDGYPEGHGMDLKAHADMELINGIPLELDDEGIAKDPEMGTMANGMGCLAAQLVRALKDGIGGIYLVPSGTRGAGEDYIYTLYPDGPPAGPGDKTGIRLKVETPAWRSFAGRVLYDGPIGEFSPEKCGEDEEETA